MSGPARKILCVDDDPVNLVVVETNLVADGYEVYKAKDGVTALHLVKALKPDVVLLDIMMPGMGGIDVLKEIKKIDPDIRVIMVTAVIDDEIAHRTLELGACDYITKPIDFDYLKAAVLQKAVPVKKTPSSSPRRESRIVLRALTREAGRALPTGTIEITHLPCYIGRRGFRSLDVSLDDREPFHVSRVHCYIDFREGKYQLVDSRSTLGTIIDGIRIGTHEDTLRILLEKGTHEIRLGTRRSPYLFALEIRG